MKWEYLQERLKFLFQMLVFFWIYRIRPHFLLCFFIFQKIPWMGIVVR